MTHVQVFAPGRVNLIGDHTDYMGGLVLPFAIDRGVTLTIRRGGANIDVYSNLRNEGATIDLPAGDPSAAEPAWARLIAGVASKMGATTGFAGVLSSDLPIAGLSSSAAVEVATALALGHQGDHLAIARTCQQAELDATGVPCGIMDQLASLAGIAGHALLIDCHNLNITPVPIPSDVEVVVVHSGQHRELANSEYAARRRQCEAAEQIIGPLRLAHVDDAALIADTTLRARARHVISESARVKAFTDALANGDYAVAGGLMSASHRSLATDFEVSTPILDDLVDELRLTPGVYGARLTGAGFGGAVIALAAPGAVSLGFVARPSQGARIL